MKPRRRGRAAAGIDLGASRIKTVRREAQGADEFASFDSNELPRVAEWARSLGRTPVGLTGAGAASFADLDGIGARTVDEFSAWAEGSGELLRAGKIALEVPYLLVSLGTGTSVLRVDAEGCTRIGGSSLGGGTLMGLAAALCDCDDFEVLCVMAARGDRRKVDLVLADVYPEEHSPLPGDVTASCLAKLAAKPRDPSIDAADRAAALMGLVGENVGLLASALARAENVVEIVYGGSALRDNATLTRLLVGIPAASGQRAHLLPDGEYAGALGALLAATAR